MDALASGAPTMGYSIMPSQPGSTAVACSAATSQRNKRHCLGETSPGEFPLAASPSVFLHILTACNLDPKDLAKLEATCSYFRKPANFAPDFDLSISEIAALDMCKKRVVFKAMTQKESLDFKKKCGGSWKLVLRFLLIGERCYRREKSQAIAGPGHSVAVASNGLVYSFGCNSFGQLGHGTIHEEWQPRQIRSLQDIRIIHAAAGPGRTMLISDAGKVYTLGKDSFGETEFGSNQAVFVTVPRLIDSLNDVFVVQATIGNFFTAVLSREGRVYTFSWGKDGRLGHQTKSNCVVPHPLLGDLENIPIVQIAAGYCYLLALACQPSGMSVYSVGCGLGGKLGHGSKSDEKHPRLIEQFRVLNLQPVVIAAGAWHAAAVGQDGRVCTWGWGRYGCLGHGNEDCETLPKVVEALSNVKAVHVATGDYTSFVVSDDGEVYSFGCGESSSLGHNPASDEQEHIHHNVLSPRIVTSLKEMKERVVQISLTNSLYWNAHTFALADSGKLYAFGAGDKGQLGMHLNGHTERDNPERVNIDLS